MFETIKRLYTRTGSKVMATNAVKKGWITQTQYAEITGETFPG